MAIKHSITLSTTEPNNEVGVIKIRQADEQTQTLEVQITENGVPKSYQGLAVYFCAKLGQTAGLGIIEQKLKPEEMTNPANGKLEYTMRAEDWQILGRQKGYFSFRKMKNEHEFIEQFTTRDFTFDVIKSVYSDGLKEVKKDGSTYVWTIEDMLRLFKEYMATGKVDWENYKNDEKTIWEKFVEDNREFLENADPGGKIILELLGARGGAQTLGERLDAEKEKLDDVETLNNFEIRSNKRNIQPLIVFAIDDGGIHDYQTLLPIFNKYGFVASSAIITNQVGNANFPYTMTWQQIKELQNTHGWEIVSHATDDVDLTTLTAQQVDDKLRIAKDALISQGLECRNFFLPRGKYSDTIKKIARKHYRSVRISGEASSGASVNTSPFDMYQVDSRFFGDSNGIDQSIDEASGKPNDSVDYFKYYIDQAEIKKGVLVIGMHGNTLMQNNRQNDLDLICEYVNSKSNVEVVTYNEMLNRVGNVIDTPDFKVGADGKIGGLYGKIKVGQFNEIYGTTEISDVNSGYVTVSTVGNGNGENLPFEIGGTIETIKPDNEARRAYQLVKPFGIDRGLHFRDFDSAMVNEWQRLDNVFVHSDNSLSHNHNLLDLKKGRVNYCTIQTASASGYPENSAGLLIVDFNTTLNTMVREVYRLNNSNKTYERYWNGTSWSAWIPTSFEECFKNKMNQLYTLPNIVSERVSNLTGGFIKNENMVHVNVKFTSAITGNGVLPLADFPVNTVAKMSQVALSAINVTDMTTTYAVLTITNGQLTANLTSGKDYVISGVYSLA